jgi:hypothetical protein
MHPQEAKAITVAAFTRASIRAVSAVTNISAFQRVARSRRRKPQMRRASYGAQFEAALRLAYARSEGAPDWLLALAGRLATEDLPQQVDLAGRYLARGPSGLV